MKNKDFESLLKRTGKNYRTGKWADIVRDPMAVYGCCVVDFAVIDASIARYGYK